MAVDGHTVCQVFAVGLQGSFPVIEDSILCIELTELVEHLQGILVADLAIVAWRGLDDQEFGLDAPEGSLEPSCTLALLVSAVVLSLHFSINDIYGRDL